MATTETKATTKSGEKTKPKIARQHCRSPTCDEKNGSAARRGRARLLSIAFMAVASAIHFAGYELARSGTLALFTSTRTGFLSPAATPLCTVGMMPFSVLTLKLYTKSLQLCGPRLSLCFSSALFAVLMISGALILGKLGDLIELYEGEDGSYPHSEVVVWRRLSQTTVFFLNVAQCSFVQLLYTQHWSFIGSLSKEWDGASIYFAPIAGLGSIASTLAALCVQNVIERSGLTGLLWGASVLFLASGFAADTAYRIAIQYHFEPTCQDGTSHSACVTKVQQLQSTKSHSSSLMETSIRLFTRVPILASLCLEVLTCQSVSSIISFLFVLKAKECIPNDKLRANWTAIWYARINFISGLLQFCVIPFLMKRCKTNDDKKYDRSDCSSQHQYQQQQRLWLLMPLAMMVCATLMIYEAENLSLILVTTSFALYKVLEYSVRGVVVEMVYISLDYESRFFGKEVIGLFVDRLGKSSTAIVLSLVSSVFGQSPLLDKAFVQALSVASLSWFFASYPLAVNSKQKVQ
eukprot:CAMPEP_0178823042 /NCGR_PEP_ID=MMETSP0746-20121128/4926_1 /TAXON_ID=913974 /ORGANISM="Nitzschia punctata, Strain CCMP561" /LENGTH=520 /DNA_ID=CAMNT_0020484611 /DNA_START=132 /DNA_END=1694 /DNA_ORIENTATION=+